jgi:hypothetical protein
LRLTFLPQGSGLPETIAITLVVLGILGLLIGFGMLFPLLRQEARADAIFMREARHEAAEAAAAAEATPPPHH